MSPRTVILLSTLVALVSGHGRVLEPVSRASAWLKGFNTEPDYDDDGVNCGGMNHQWSFNEGRCGICGDAYDLPTPRPHELGGKFGLGVIVAHYEPGSIISTEVQLSTSHKGFWEFKLCPDPEDNSQECFDKYPLELEDGGYKAYANKGSVIYKVNYKLPKNLVCEHCVIQWRYTAGNNWGDCGNGTQGIGCGIQEQFGACSDVSIGLSLYNEVDYRPQRFRVKPKPAPLIKDPMYWEIQEDLKQILAQSSKVKLQKLKNRKKQRLNSKKPRKKPKKKYTKKKSKNYSFEESKKPYSDFDPSIFGGWDWDSFENF